MVIGGRTAGRSIPHNLTQTALGLSLFWMGSFGFNGGSGCSLDMQVINAFVSVQIAACFGGITWVLNDYFIHGKLTSLGFCSGAISGLVCITPASGYTSVYFSPIFGVIGALAGNNSCFLKSKFQIDDSLDAFAVHGVVGFVSLVLLLNGVLN